MMYGTLKSEIELYHNYDGAYIRYEEDGEILEVIDEETTNEEYEEIMKKYGNCEVKAVLGMGDGQNHYIIKK